MKAVARLGMLPVRTPTSVEGRLSPPARELQIFIRSLRRELHHCPIPASGKLSSCWLAGSSGGDFSGVTADGSSRAVS